MGNEHDTPSTPKGLDESALRAASRQGLLTGEQVDLLLEDLAQGISIDTLILGERLGLDEGTSEDLVRLAGALSSRSVPQDEEQTVYEPEALPPEPGSTLLSGGFFEPEAPPLNRGPPCYPMTSSRRSARPGSDPGRPGIALPSSRTISLPNST